MCEYICKTCTYFTAFTEWNERTDEWYDIDSGRCHRYPPQYDGTKDCNFALTNNCNKCGEWSEIV